ncbi:AAA family ATPase [Thioalkalivibrio thiocyanodenitrificans]|uniref:AAA family ATPase n=1 Tax=Thioalkalivibrio thiocyanodenitrificans TaxID=243063 RepID=UPI000363BA87|nr:ATP-binding protein [Thioalkalivibrio thiocyanodenitrificans]
MATKEHVLALADAALKGERDRVSSICQQIIARERQGSTLKRALAHKLNSITRRPEMVELDPKVRPLVLEQSARIDLSGVVLDEGAKDAVESFLDERRYAEQIKAAGLPVPHKLLLSGPPGNGKTTLAAAIAKELGLPFWVADFSSIISSMLGETGAKLAKLFRAASSHSVVLFIDELETVLTERDGGGRDVGEVGRVVSTLLLEIDRLPDNVILIGATNHEELLDRAVVRRFNTRVELSAPSVELARRWLRGFAETVPGIPVLEHQDELLSQSPPRSISALEEQVTRWCRQWVIEKTRRQSSADIKVGARVWYDADPQGMSGTIIGIVRDREQGPAFEVEFDGQYEHKSMVVEREELALL